MKLLPEVVKVGPGHRGLRQLHSNDTEGRLIIDGA